MQLRQTWDFKQRKTTKIHILVSKILRQPVGEEEKGEKKRKEEEEEEEEEEVEGDQNQGKFSF